MGFTGYVPPTIRFVDADIRHGLLLILVHKS